ncbi:dicarboxylic acid transporter [Cylindrobasidium torrendii FP15055 ss-10]|uniref:Dicarboxylic acid transporter n=1 Tax=Cylindrobasidium torrendii FP15055 ss-10 TaxID=1314674 RepID=A0A0D7BAG5_9AGAR|nr:dicarboxylic acid transporter [Cylindrobasidium torrendii FP15055 ss-10]
MPGEYPFWLGGVAASMAACCTHPLDVTKVRMQTLQHNPDVKRPSMIRVFQQSVAKHGITSLYTGLTAALLRQMTYSLVRLGAYDELKSRLSKDGPPSTVKSLLAASVAGALGGVAGNPADILVVRMTSDVTRPPEQRYGYRNAFSGLVRIVQEEGVKGLARGLEANVTRAVLMNMSQVWSYDFFKTSLLHRTIPLTDYRFREGLPLHVAASILAGTVATTVCSPADVLRSRVMSCVEGQSMITILKTSLAEEGPAFLLKGWTPAFIRLGPNTVLMFVFYEQLKLGWKKLTQ